jgi:hypothetical protein
MIDINWSGLIGLCGCIVFWGWAAWYLLGSA